MDAGSNAVGWWRALSDVMGTRPRLDLATADRLAAGDPPDDAYPGLDRLLAAARAPARPEELVGEWAAVDGYITAYRSTPQPRRVRAPLRGGLVAAKSVAVAAVLAFGGTALAAETGTLPPSVQRHAHGVFGSLVPAPGPDRHGSQAGTPGPAVSATDPAPASGSPVPSADAQGLCHAWQAAQDDPRGRAMTAESRHALAALAGDEPAVPGFCAGVLGTAPGQGEGHGSGQKQTGPADPPTPTHPGNGGNPHGTPSHPARK